MYKFNLIKSFFKRKLILTTKKIFANFFQFFLKIKSIKKFSEKKNFFFKIIWKEKKIQKFGQTLKIRKRKNAICLSELNSKI